jgi:hypothetical protein
VFEISVAMLFIRKAAIEVTEPQLMGTFLTITISATLANNKEVASLSLLFMTTNFCV